MAHHSATKKSIKQIAKKTEANISAKNKIRSAVKTVKSAVIAQNADESNTALKNAQKELDKGVTKGLVKKKTASRVLSRLNKSVKAIATKK